VLVEVSHTATRTREDLDQHTGQSEVWACIVSQLHNTQTATAPELSRYAGCPPGKSSISASSRPWLLRRALHPPELSSHHQVRGCFPLRPRGQLCSAPCETRPRSSPALAVSGKGVFGAAVHRSGTAPALPATPSLALDLATIAPSIWVCARGAGAWGTLSHVQVPFFESLPDWQHRKGGLYHRFGPTACEIGKEQLRSLQLEKDPEKALSHTKARIA